MSWKVCLFVGIAWVLCQPVQAESTWLEQLLAGYDQIESVTTDVRRDISNEDGNIRWLSRVYFQRPDRMHSENFIPLPRRIIADGEEMFQHNAGHPRGFRRRIEDLDETMLYNLRRVPGTAMEHLFRLQGAPEEVLPGTEEYPVRHAYTVNDVYVIIEADAEERPVRIGFYTGPDREQMTGEIISSHFEEVLDGVWIGMRQQSQVTVDGKVTREMVRFGNYEVNMEIPPRLFDADVFFEGVRWVDRFDQL